MNGAKPNDAHYALAQCQIPVITMNIDGLHKLAGSDALELHGGLPEDDEMDIAYSLYNKPVLYGDPAPNYQKAYEMVYDLEANDIFIVIGCSYHTAIACDLREVARSRGAKIIEIQEDAAHNVRKVLEELKKSKRALEVLHCKIEEQYHYSIPDSDFYRVLAVFKKEAKLQKKYPRQAGKPKREPL